MGKKPLFGLAGLFLAGIAITSTGCGKCTSCNTQPTKFNPGSTFGKGPTPPVGDRRPAEVAGDPAAKPAPTPPGGEAMPVGGPPPGPVGSLKPGLPAPVPPVTPVSMQDNLPVPGRSPLDDSAVTPPRSALPVPPTPVRSTLSDTIPATPMAKRPAELPKDTTAAPTLPPVTTSVPSDMPPEPRPPVTSTPSAPPSLPGTGTPLPPLGTGEPKGF